MRDFNKYLNEAIVICQKQYGNMTPEFTKANKELVAQGLLMEDIFVEVIKKQEESLEIQRQILAELKNTNTPSTPRKTTTTKK